MLAAPQVDVAVRGEGEFTAADLIEHFVTHWDDPHRMDGLADIAWITFRGDSRSSELIRTVDRPRIDDLDQRN